MKILIVCRKQKGEPVSQFILDQEEALNTLGHQVSYVTVKRGGLGGYFELYRELMKTLQETHPDIVHAHYGLCGLVANMQRKVPVVVTYPGSDVNNRKIRPLSVISMWLSKYNIFMSNPQLANVRRFANPKKTEILRYGISLDIFKPIDQKKATQLFTAARPQEVNWKEGEKVVLFSSKFIREDKDPDLAREAVRQVSQKRLKEGKSAVRLIQIQGDYTKEEMAWQMNMVDAGILTSKAEGSPQFTKEVMACGTPIVCVNVGDVAEQLAGLEGCWVAKTRDPEELSELLEKALDFGKTQGHQHIKDMHLDRVDIAQRLVEIYSKFVK